MTKLEKIKEAYGEHYEAIKEHIREYDSSLPTFKHFMFDCGFWYNELGFKHEDVEHIEGDCEASRWRPKSLNGIEDNNGWKKIESEDDLPKEKKRFMVYFDSSEEDYNSFFDLFNFFDKNGKILHPSHWKPIVKDLPPIY